MINRLATLWLFFSTTSLFTGLIIFYRRLAMKITEQDWYKLPLSLRKELGSRDIDTVDLLQIIIYLANRVERLENQGKQV